MLHLLFRGVLHLTRRGAGFFEVGNTFVDQYEDCSNLGSVVRLPCPSGYMICFFGNDYLISWKFSCGKPKNKIFLDEESVILF